MIIVMSVHHHHHHHCALDHQLLRHHPFFFKLRFRCPVRPDLRCRRCADMTILMTAGDAEDAS